MARAARLAPAGRPALGARPLLRQMRLSSCGASASQLVNVITRNLLTCFPRPVVCLLVGSAMCPGQPNKAAWVHLDVTSSSQGCLALIAPARLLITLDPNFLQKLLERLSLAMLCSGSWAPWLTACRVKVWWLRLLLHALQQAALWQALKVQCNDCCLKCFKRVWWHSKFCCVKSRRPKVVTLRSCRAL